MAYIQSTEDQQLNQPGAPGAGAGQQPPVSTSSGGVGGSAPAANPQGVTATPASTKAPPVQDLKAYLSANAPQAVGMGNKIAGGINDETGRITGNINQGVNDVAAGVQAQVVPYNPNIVIQAAGNPTKFVEDPKLLNDFLAQENAQYNGPENFGVTDQSKNLNKEIGDFTSKIPDINSPEGIQQLVRSQEKNPTAGMTNLDTLIMQGTPESITPISGAVTTAKGLPGVLDQGAAAVNENISNAIANNAKARSNVQDRFLTGKDAVVPKWQKSLSDRVSGAQLAGEKYDALIDKLIQQQTGAIPYVNELKKYASPSTPHYNDAFDWYSNTPDKWGSATPAAVAYKSDYEMEAALNKLMNNLNLQDLNPADIGKAGTYAPSNSWGYSPVNASVKLNPLEDYLKGSYNPGRDTAFKNLRSYLSSIGG